MGSRLRSPGFGMNGATKATGENLTSCAMVIAEPNKFVAEVHDRMPVVLEAESLEQWEKGSRQDAAAAMKPAAEDVATLTGVEAGKQLLGER